MTDLDGLQRALGLRSAVIDHPVAADDRHLFRDRLLVDDFALLGLDVLDHVIGSRARRLGACRQRNADDERASQRKIDLHLVFSRTETSLSENMSIVTAVPMPAAVLCFAPPSQPVRWRRAGNLHLTQPSPALAHRVDADP